MISIDKPFYVCYSLGMSLLETYFFHPAEKEAMPIAIIPLFKTSTLLLEPLLDYPVWYWSAQSARAENIRPVVATDSSIIRSQCMSIGVDVLLLPKGTKLLDALSFVLHTFPNTCFFLMDAQYPVRARGILCTMLAQYYHLQYPSSLIAPGLSLHNSAVFLATHELKFKLTSTLIKFPKIAASSIKTSAARTALAAQLQEPTMRCYNPWFTPSSIAVIDGAVPFPKQYTSTFEECDMYAYIYPFTETTSSPTLSYHTYIYPGEKNLPGEEAAPAVHYMMYPTPRAKNSGWNISAWNNPTFPGALITPFSKCLALLHTFYPESKLVFVSFVVALAQDNKYGHELRERAVIFEKLFSSNIQHHPLFLNLTTAPPKPDLKKKVQPAVKDIAAILAEVGNDIDYSQYAVIHAYHKTWVDRLILDKQYSIGIRFSTNDKFTYKWDTPNNVQISWERYGTENFIRKDKTNLWKLSTIAD